MKIKYVLLLFWISFLIGQAPGQAVNTKARDFKLPDESGRKVSLNDYTGKVILMDVWATWCGPCRASMPHVQQLHEKYGDRGLVVIGVNIEGHSPNVMRYIQKGRFTFTMLFDKTKTVNRLYQIRGIPRTFLIDKDMIIRYAGHPMGLKGDLIEDLLEGDLRDKRTGRPIAARREEKTKADSKMGAIASEARLYYDKAMNYKETGEFGRAADAFKDAIELAPEYLEAHREYLALMRRMGKEKQLAEDYEEFLQAHPKSAVTYYMYGLSLSAREMDEREKAFKKAIELKPDFAEAYHELSAVYQAKNLKDEAEAALKKARELKPGSTAAQRP